MCMKNCAGAEGCECDDFNLKPAAAATKKEGHMEIRSDKSTRWVYVAGNRHRLGDLSFQHYIARSIPVAGATLRHRHHHQNCMMALGYIFSQA